MNGDFFDRLEVELADIAHRGMHLDGPARDRRHVLTLVRRSVVIAVLALALAVTLVSEFPASANGHSQVAQVAQAYFSHGL